ncbi:MAG TPA: hypothetical protein VES64_06415 [Allosphingosinicella sp.]|nr:hypothetical protein [Allosphingosinicella sp.]
MGWTGELDGIETWLHPFLAPLTIDGLERLRDLLLAACAERSCTGPLVIGRQKVERELERKAIAQAQARASRERAEAAREAEQARRDERSLRWSDQKIALIAAFVGGLFGLLAGWLPSIAGRRDSRRQAEAHQATMQRLTDILHSLQEKGVRLATQQTSPLKRKPPRGAATKR